MARTICCRVDEVAPRRFSAAMHARITLHGEALLADPGGGLFAPDQQTLIVADMHLEKGSHYARGGRFLPPYDSRETIERLVRNIRRYRPRRLVCLGDAFHDEAAGERLDAGDRERLLRLATDVEWIWVLGNHDASLPDWLPGERTGELPLGSLVLRHEPKLGASPGEICGHLHPKAAVAAAGTRITGSCFVTDGRRMIMPAFGAYAGGLDALDPAIASLFGRAGFRVFLIGRDRLHMFPHTRLAAIARESRDAPSHETPGRGP
jgi:DNA ligase-associated metallophosphoesterase